MAAVPEVVARPLDLAAALKESGLVAIVALGLAFGLVGFKTEDVPAITRAAIESNLAELEAWYDGLAARAS